MSRIVIGDGPTVHRPESPTIQAGTPKAPVLPFTAQGLADGIALAGAHVRWNTTRHAPMIALRDKPEVFGDDETTDELFNAVSLVARGQRGRTFGPYWIPGARQEKRLLGVVARWDAYTGDGDAVYEHVRSWCAEQRANGIERRLSLTVVMRESESLRGYETGPRSDYVARRSATDCLTAYGWRWVSARPLGSHGGCIPGANPRKLWCSPAGTTL